jgi:hypothetical protein
MIEPNALLNFTCPLEGEVGAEGAGRGVLQINSFNPPPQPSPSRGEGAVRRQRIAS